MIAIDLFAGAGGFTEGAEAAGAQVIWAANHWRLAVETHERNHPATAHLCQDLHQADWYIVPRHDLLLASPSCQGHSPARGKDQPRHDAARATAWAVVSAAEVHRPAVVVVENVPAFRAWVLYPAWEQAMQALGYTLAEHVVDASDVGVPQARVRLFIIATRTRAPLRLALPRREPKAVRDCIAWDRHRWSPIDRPGRAPATLARIARGRAEHGHAFLVPFYGSGSGETGRSLDRPCGTVTTLDRWAVVCGSKMRMLQPDELRTIMGFRPDYWLPTQRRPAIMLLGNAVCPPVAEALVSAIRGAA